MANYLFKAGDNQMAYWKNIAEMYGYSFAAFLREAAQEKADRLEGRAPVERPADTRQFAQIPGRKVEVTPDFKPEKKRRR